MQTRGLISTALVLIVIAWASQANAGIVIQTGNNPQPGELSINFATNQLGHSVSGTAESTGIGVLFTSTNDTLVATSATNAVSAADGNLTDIRVSVPGGDFGDFIFNAVASVGGQIIITASAEVGVNVTGWFDIAPGNNFFTVYTVDGERLRSININPSVQLNNIDSSSISSPVAPVPEPSSLILLGSGLAGFAGMLCRKLRR